MSQVAASQPIPKKESSGQHGWLWLTIPITALMALASAVGAFVPAFYGRDKPYFAVQGVGQDFVNLFIVVPVLSISGILAARGSRRAVVIWLGGVIYTLYSYIIYAFAAHFNSLFLVYVALLGCSLYALIFSLRGIDAKTIQRQMLQRGSAKATGVVLAIIAALFYTLWLKDVIPALVAGTIPQTLIDNGLPTSPVYILDMAVLLPGLILVVLGLRRQNPLSTVLAPSLLTFIVLLGLALMSMGVVMIRAGFGSDFSVVIIFTILTLTSLGLLTWYLKDLRQH